MSIDLTLDNILSKRKSVIKNTKIIRDKRIDKLKIIFFQELRNVNIWKDMCEGIYCDCCGKKLNPFNRIHNLCRECNQKLEESLREKNNVHSNNY